MISKCGYGTIFAQSAESAAPKRSCTFVASRKIQVDGQISGIDQTKLMHRTW